MSLRMSRLNEEHAALTPVWPGTIPKHVAIIMDGNGRWAKKRSLPRSIGHSRGVEAVRRTVSAALEFGIEYLTLYSFSSENWSRPKDEVGYLLNLLRRFAKKDVGELHALGVQIRIIGDRTSLSPDIVALIERTEALTRHNKALHLVVAFNYGARDELARAMRTIARAVQSGELSADDVDSALIDRHLDTAGIPDPDLLIRTSGEQRLSNFLLWQSAYSEFVFVDEPWPDFDRELFAAAIRAFMARDRRFGGLAASTL